MINFAMYPPITKSKIASSRALKHPPPMTTVLQGITFNAILIVFTVASAFGGAPLLSDCEVLPTLHWSGFRIDLAELREASEDQPAHCFVQGTIDTEIHFELFLPLADAWNGRFVMGGSGGYAGIVENQALDWLTPSVLKDGFATVGTDTGHQGGGTDASWALGREDREINFGYRAVHVTAETAKTIIRIHYDRDIDYSYFVGCSRGGGQAMVASQRYPDDFDGIVAGDPVFNWTAVGAQMIQISKAMYPDPTNLSTPVVRLQSRKILEEAILAKCDVLDGLKDGIMNDPRTCDF